MILSTEGLTLKYKDGASDRIVLDDICVSLDNSATNIIVGPSGSGKSSLIYLLSTLRKPNTGKVFFNGVELTGTKDAERIRYEKFGFVFQQHFLIPYLSVMENVCLSRLDRDLRNDAAQILEKLGVASLSNKMPFEISGGERQRVAIARALVKQPTVIFADEPTASLDKDNATNIYSLLKEVAKKQIIILATHDVSLLTGEERVLRIENSKLLG